MLGSLYPRPDAGRRRHRGGRHRRHRRAPHQPAVRRPDPAGPLRAGPRAEPAPARARRADRRPRRRGPPGVLGHDARLRVGRSHGRVRHPLPRGGRRLRRPHRADGRRPRRRRRLVDARSKRRVGRRTIRATLPGVAVTDAGRARRRRRGRPPRRHRRAHVHRLRPRHPRPARRPPRRPRHRDPRRRPRGRLRRAHRPSDAASRGTRMRHDAMDRPRTTATAAPDATPRRRAGRHLRPLRAAAHRSATAGSSSSPWSSRSCCSCSWPGRTGTRRCRASRSRPTTWPAWSAWGTMAAVIAGGARIAAERAIGWNRQLRVSPLRCGPTSRPSWPPATSSRWSASPCCTSPAPPLGVRLSAGHWLEMTVLILIGLIPFAVLGILLGHLLTIDSMGPAIGGHHRRCSPSSAGPGVRRPTAGWLFAVVKCLPSYWLVQAAKTGVRRRRLAGAGLDRARRVDRRSWPVPPCLPAGPDPGVTGAAVL